MTEINLELGKELLQEQKSNIDIAFEKLEEIQSVYKERGRRWYDSPFPIIDKYTQGIIEGKVYTIGAFSNTWKSQLLYEYASYFLKKDKKVMFISTEVGVWDLLWYIARNFYRTNYKDVMKAKQKLEKTDFKKLSLFEDIKDVQGIRSKYEEYKPDIIIIDFIQAVSWIWGTEYEKMTNLAHEIQILAIEKNITVFSASQVNNESRKTDWNSITLKWSWALFHASDIVFGMYWDNWIRKISIAKNKFWPAKIIFDMEIDFENWWVVRLSESLEQDSWVDILPLKL